ncbi:MAG TPA: SDR family oxidoreductase [Pseudonocardiaceae bacterium]|nr:SDR family oxidoreductase [Pseudonocardiaceae bacterium]
MTTIAVFGATGKTGRLVVERALAAGHEVRALVRDPAKLTATGERLTVVKGDVLDAAAVGETVRDAEVVLSLFGHVPGSPKTLQTDGTQLIVDAMHRHGVKRIISLSGGGLRDAQDRPKLSDHIIRFLLKTMAGHVLADAEHHLEVLQASGLDWTVVRAPRLLDTPATGSYRVGSVGVEASTKISRADFADFILTQVDDRSYIRQLPFVSA